MKKSLFLSLAALAFAGSAWAQTPVTVTNAATTTLPSIVDVSSASAVSLITNGDQTGLPTAIRMTKTGNYNFLATGTDWFSKLGTDWNSVVQGSNLTVTTTAAIGSNVQYLAGDATKAPVTVSATASLKQSILELTDVNISSNSTLSLKESVIDKSGSSLSCDYTSSSITLTATDIPTLTISAQKSAYCTSDATSGIKLDLSANNLGYKYYFVATFARTGGSSPLADLTASKQLFSFTAPSTAPTAANPWTWDVTSFTGYQAGPPVVDATAGVYKLSVKQVWDEVSLNAANRTATDNDAKIGDITNYDVFFAVVPSPKPTLKTNTIK